MIIKSTLSGIQFIFFLLAALVVQEYAVRLALPSFDPTQHLRFEPSTGDLPILGARNTKQRLVKNSGDYDVAVHFNKYGLRDDRDLAHAGLEDVLFVGDSFGFGWGVNEGERVTEKLESLLGLKVFNLAIPNNVAGYHQMLDYAKQHGSRATDVIVGINMSDDVMDYESVANQPKQLNESATVQRETFGLLAVKEFLLAHSGLYFMATNLVNRVPWLRHQLVALGVIIPLDQVPSRTLSEVSIKSTIAKIATIRSKYRVTVLIIPYRGVWVGEQTVNETRYHERFTSALSDAGIPFVDMKSVQEDQGNPMKFHFQNDAHWNASGHVLAAEALAAEMRRRRIPSNL
ncbi:MAG: hypothetical protein O3A84_05630 [Proteobacteria bacterium]|nr:hypothetical protein [Pseudomonadota bacterium]